MMMTEPRFRGGGSFTIVQFTDLHFMNGGDLEQRASYTMARILDLEKPDLTVLTGDVISGGDSKDPAWALRFALKPVTDRNVPFAMLFGNHDDEGTLSRKALQDVLKTLPNNLTEAGPPDLPGVGNFPLFIQGNQGSPAAILHFVDSLSYAPK